MGIDPLMLREKYRTQVQAQKKASPSRVSHQGVQTLGNPVGAKSPMNRTETELYGMLKARGYDRVEFEAITLTLATGSRFTPDFLTVSGSIVTFFECKNNFIREAALVRLKVAARAYPFFIFILAQKKAGIWKETIIQP